MAREDVFEAFAEYGALSLARPALRVQQRIDCDAVDQCDHAIDDVVAGGQWVELS